MSKKLNLAVIASISMYFTIQFCKTKIEKIYTTLLKQCLMSQLKCKFFSVFFLLKNVGKYQYFSYTPVLSLGGNSVLIVV